MSTHRQIGLEDRQVPRQMFNDMITAIFEDGFWFDPTFFFHEFLDGKHSVSMLLDSFDAAGQYIGPFSGTIKAGNKIKIRDGYFTYKTQSTHFTTAYGPGTAYQGDDDVWYEDADFSTATEAGDYYVYLRLTWTGTHLTYTVNTSSARPQEYDEAPGTNKVYQVLGVASIVVNDSVPSISKWFQSQYGNFRVGGSGSTMTTVNRYYKVDPSATPVVNVDYIIGEYGQEGAESGVFALESGRIWHSEITISGSVLTNHKYQKCEPLS